MGKKKSGSYHGHLSGDGYHIENEKSPKQQYIEQYYNHNHDIDGRCRYNINGKCNRVGFINKGLNCKRPRLCDKYVRF